jgi:hypothetical protein
MMPEDKPTSKRGRATPKSRDNWNSSCVRFGCANKGQLCNQCYKFDMYKDGK